MNPYTSDLIPLLFNETIDVQSIRQKLEKVSQDYKTGKRGLGSRSKGIEFYPSNSIPIEELLIERGIDIKKYNQSGIFAISRNGKERINLYVRCFNLDPNKPRQYDHYLATDIENISDDDWENFHFPYKKSPSYNSAFGIVDNQKRDHAPSNLFDVIYCSTTVEKNAWLLIEEYLEDFASPHIRLKNGEGIVDKFYVSPRKYIIPAKVNIKLESMNYSAWIPFGFCEKYPTFEEAKKEIRQRLQNANLPGLKLTFTRETVARK